MNLSKPENQYGETKGKIRAGLLSFILSVIWSFGLQYYVGSTTQA